MNADPEKLIALERVNLEIVRLSDEVAALPKRVAMIEAKLASAKNQVEAAKADIRKSDSTKKKHESDIQDWQQKIIKYREQQAAVKTNDQYRALLHEIEFVEKQISESEEKILIEMEAADALHKTLKAAEAELKADEIEVDQEKAHARSLTAEDEKKLTELRAERESLRATIDPGALANYDRVAARLKNVLAEARDQKCTACHVMVRPQRYNELLSGSELITCDSCGRILYFDPAHTEAPRRASVEREWYFLPSAHSGRFGFFANSKSGCSMVLFDATSGQRVDSSQKKKVSYQEAFAELLMSAVHLHLQFAPEPDEEYLPSEILEELQLQARIAPGASA
jgi:predicted  nucleic acid-binding Zn-ribbon protein